MENIPGTCHGFKWTGNEFNKTLHKWGNKHNGGHALQRSVDTKGKSVVRGRKMFGLHSN